MINISQSTIINRPVEEVFAYVMDVSNDVHWQTGTIAVSVDSPMRKGARLTSVRSNFGLRIQGTTEVIEYEPNKKRVTRGIGGPFQVTATQVYEPLEKNQSRMTFQAEVVLSGFFRLIEGIIGKRLDRIIESFLANLKRNLEAA